MTPLFNPTVKRIALAIALSIALHGMVLWLPDLHLPVYEKKLPPLIAKLEPLPKVTAKIAAAQPKPVAKPEPRPNPVVATPIDVPIAASAPVIASAPLATSAVTEAEPSPPPAVEITDPSPPEPTRPPLPKHARLKFDVYQGQGNFKVGESVHSLDIEEGRYSLKADVHTTGLVSVLKSYRMVQTSTGNATTHTLQPTTFTEEVTDSSGKQTHRAEFDWANKKIRFSKGDEAPLSSQAQDILSILYQFPPMSQQMEIVTIQIGTGKKFEEYRFEIAFAETLETPMGNLQTVHFRKLHATNEEGLEIWFAQAYRLLPVKMRHIDNSGKIDGEATITDIRVSDE